MTNRIDPFNSPAEDINRTANDDMVIMNDLAVDDPRAMAFGVSPNIENSDNSRFHSVSYDELDREADEDLLALESLICEPDKTIGTTVTHTSAKILSSCNIQATDTCNAFSMAQSLMEKCAFLLVDKAVYCYIDRAYVLLDDVALDRLIFQFHKDAISMQGKTSIITKIRKFIKLGDVLGSVETDQEHIVFLNGRYNLADNLFEPNGLDIFATSYLNFEYDPDARDCEHFKAFLKFASGGNDSLKQLILEVMGYLLSCNNTAKKFFVLFGPGNTGKSLFLSLMREFFPMQFVSTIELQELGGAPLFNSITPKIVRRRASADCIQPCLKRAFLRITRFFHHQLDESVLHNILGGVEIPCYPEQIHQKPVFIVADKLRHTALIAIKETAVATCPGTGCYTVIH